MTISLTQLGSTPGNISAHQLRHLARLARGYSLSEIRTTKNKMLSSRL
ncbi:MAG: hypothetical protein Rsou_0932 [Candidatus Ruthia sp. Asou_11_S2]|nr:hypothetical protein [Candidatus Ruthia sp. Asou_11_S2]